MIILLTRRGRRYFIKDIPDRGDGPYTNGYVEVDEAMIGDSVSQFAQEIVLAQGISFFGKAFLDQPSPDGGPTISGPETPSRGRRYIWVIGFDDHTHHIGRQQVFLTTQQLADQLDNITDDPDRFDSGGSIN